MRPVAEWLVTIDLLPTICEATETPLPAGVQIDGVSLMPLLQQTGSIDRPALYWHFPHYWWGGRLAPFSVIRHGKWKLIKWYEGGARELYNLADDVSERKDLAGRLPERAQELESMLEAWLDRTGARLPRHLL